MKKPLILLIVVLIFAQGAPLASSRALGAASPAQSAPLPHPVLVAAFYYPWYGNPTFDGGWIHWDNRYQPPQDISSDYYPTLGPYSVRDPAVLDQQMEWLQDAGVDLIVASWWGQDSYEDNAMPVLLAHAAAYGIRVAFHIENYIGRSAEKLVEDIQYIYEQYGDSPAFFRSVEGSRYSAGNKASGLFFLWAPQQQYGEGPPADAAYWLPALDQIHALPDGGIVLACTIDPTWIDLGHFDGEYNYVDLNYQPDWSDWASGLPEGAWFVPSVIPGFSANRIGYDPSVNRSRDDGKTYAQQWQAALEAGVSPQIVAITSFNEWHEGTQIEPAAQGVTDSTGYTYLSYNAGPNQYLEATAQWSQAAHTWPGYACAQTISVRLRVNNLSDGIYQVEQADGLTEPVSIGGRQARRAVANPFGGARYIYFQVINDFLYAEQAALTVTVDYYDVAGGSFTVQYDSTDPAWPISGAYKDAAWVDFGGSNQWLTATFTLPDAYFANRQNGRADLRIAGPDSNFYISQVTISKPAAPCTRVYLPLLFEKWTTQIPTLFFPDLLMR
ncbi:MAG: hypothetical protein JW726_01070 [Anaerolineales bacterium]|nr:hypothetical protein [Anaerolineales bacterium]